MDEKILSLIKELSSKIKINVNGKEIKHTIEIQKKIYIKYERIGKKIIDLVLEHIKNEKEKEIKLLKNNIINFNNNINEFIV